MTKDTIEEIVAKYEEKFKVKKVDNGLHMITLTTKPIYLEIDPYVVIKEMKAWLTQTLKDYGDAVRAEEREKIYQDLKPSLDKLEKLTGRLP